VGGRRLWVAMVTACFGAVLVGGEWTHVCVNIFALLSPPSDPRPHMDAVGSSTSLPHRCARTFFDGELRALKARSVSGVREPSLTLVLLCDW
jgi:hypothetical protein